MAALLTMPSVLYLTMRFAKTIKQIQGLQAYHAGDKLNVEVDIVLDASTALKDSHDLAYALPVPFAFLPALSPFPAQKN